ncbi:16S rRNA (cytidine(1402)-2'-O)-methyltransferase [Rhizobium alvei]|uniref:Ribosomal RNA small subunit methyltransferase I n=1 Tax=Rhizobium alvei TaxID=1132659 RepID=A0ABT8YPI0_9HYPH|nr:16S rRNA (cytidine(1402)-2'-O)-methyltransferase [Rhizobium alvei]MDO6965607.1 16S rRNA (cytidine(1402)-2'-O)-methyltransferase [Rhizobium alvei]
MSESEAKDGAGSKSYRIRTLEIPARPLEPGLYLVSTPIGNLSDITLRALETIAAADILAAEDTRVTRVLLERYAIGRRTIAYHDHNARDAGERLLADLDRGLSVAIVSDAGTPLISDPGYRLAQAAIEAGHRVFPIPGPSSVITALSASGLPSDSFFFAGFLPQKEKARRDRLAEIGTIPGTLLYFESPHRLAASLEDASLVLGGERAACVCRELTKTFEEFRRGSLAELADFYAAQENIRGEIVVAIAPPPEAQEMAAEDVDALLLELARTMPTAKAATEAARRTGEPRKVLYQRLLDLKAT